MKTKILLTLFVVLAGFMVSAQDVTRENTTVVIENQSRYSFTATVDTLSKMTVSNGWKVTIIHDLQETMKKNGKEVLPVKVMEICNPNHAFQILSRDDLRDVSPMLPCRISVYEKADGKTYVSRMNAPALAGIIGGDAAETIILAFNEVEEFVKPVIQ